MKNEEADPILFSAKNNVTAVNIIDGILRNKNFTVILCVITKKILLTCSICHACRTYFPN